MSALEVVYQGEITMTALLLMRGVGWGVGMQWFASKLAATHTGWGKWRVEFARLWLVARDAVGFFKTLKDPRTSWSMCNSTGSIEFSALAGDTTPCERCCCYRVESFMVNWTLSELLNEFMWLCNSSHVVRRSRGRGGSWKHCAIAIINTTLLGLTNSVCLSQKLKSASGQL